MRDVFPVGSANLAWRPGFPMRACNAPTGDGRLAEGATASSWSQPMMMTFPSAALARQREGAEPPKAGPEFGRGCLKRQRHVRRCSTAPQVRNVVLAVELSACVARSRAGEGRIAGPFPAVRLKSDSLGRGAADAIFQGMALAEEYAVVGRIRGKGCVQTRNLGRAYGIQISMDLSGRYVVAWRWGRIGLPGQTRRKTFAAGDDAARHLRALLQRPYTAPHRLDVPYRSVNDT